MNKIKENIEKLKKTKNILNEKRYSINEKWVFNDLWGFEGYIHYSKRNKGFLINYFSTSNDVYNFIDYVKDKGYNATIIKRYENDIRMILVGANFFYKIYIYKDGGNNQLSKD